MNKKQRIRFIYNPNSGVKRKVKIPELIKEVLDYNLYEVDIKEIIEPGDGAKFSKEAKNLGYDIVTVIGGDGTVNKIGSELIGSNTALGIIPTGSGNGIARSLGIPMNIRKAISTLNYGKIRILDTGLLDDHHFIGIAGIGFDAVISKKFDEAPTRGKFTYGYLISKELLKFKSFNAEVTGNGVSVQHQCVLVAFANTIQYGNSAFIAPHALPFDGKLNLVMVKPTKLYQIPSLTGKLFRKKIHASPSVHNFTFTEINVKHESRLGHVDGEAIEIGGEICVKIVPQSLKVISPNRPI